MDAWVAESTGLGGRLNPSSLLAWQLDRARETIARARRDSAHYRGALAAASLAVDSPAALDTIPFTRSEELAADSRAFLAVPASRVERATSVESSGSQGPRKRLFFTRGDLGRTADFFRAGMEGVLSDSRSLLVLLSGGSPGSLCKLLAMALEGLVDRVETLVPAWDSIRALEAAARAECIVCSPAQALYLCRSEPGLRPKGLLLSSDYASLAVLDAVEEAWGLRPLDHYGMTEVGFGLAVQCSGAGGRHLRAPDILVEVVDPVSGARLQDGEVGEIVVTTLRQEAMPLVRYRTGDLGSLERGRCACGSTLPRLGRVLGRIGRGAPREGVAVPAIARLDEVLYVEPGLRAYSPSLMTTGGAARLRLSVDAPWGIDEDAVRARLPSRPPIEFEYAAIDPFSDRRKRSVAIGAAPLST